MAAAGRFDRVAEDAVRSGTTDDRLPRMLRYLLDKVKVMKTVPIVLFMIAWGIAGALTIWSRRKK
jgi:hypothetical protein